MKIIFIRLFTLYCIVQSVICSAQLSINALSSRNGAVVLRAPASRGRSYPTKVGNWSAEALIDGFNHTGWCCSPGTEAPWEFVFELSEEFIISHFGFNNQCEKYIGIYAKDILIETSVVSDTSGFVKAGDFQLMENGRTSYLTIEPITVRWIKISILTNYGHDLLTELMEIEALGAYKNPDYPDIDISGVWKTQWGEVNLHQDGTSIHACYDYNEGQFHGGIEGRYLNCRYEEYWKEDDYRGWGLVTLVVNKEANRLNGIFGYESDLKEYGFWNFTKTNKKPKICPFMIENEDSTNTDTLSRSKPTIYRDDMSEQMKADGKVIVYGINFEKASAKIKKNSVAVLSRISKMLISNPQMHIRIEGHTDDTGENYFNQTLSEQRAESVKNFMTEFYSIESERLEIKGMGSSAPISDNDTEVGRAANRRVELILVR